MIEHYLPNKNESATVPKFQLSLQLNTALLLELGPFLVLCDNV